MQATEPCVPVRNECVISALLVLVLCVIGAATLPIWCAGNRALYSSAVPLRFQCCVSAYLALCYCVTGA